MVVSCSKRTCYWQGLGVKPDKGGRSLSESAYLDLSTYANGPRHGRAWTEFTVNAIVSNGYSLDYYATTYCGMQILLGSTATKSNSGKGGRKRGDGFFSLAGPRVENRQSIQWGTCSAMTQASTGNNTARCLSCALPVGTFLEYLKQRERAGAFHWAAGYPCGCAADRLSHRAASYYGPIPGYWKSRNTGSNGTPFVIYQVNAYQL
ncbi:hypothetical protein M0657_008043 [Pyricularia oryzae]|uniref:Uncharacterized protein n=1 Tax=Pyricularia oryzae TaxID=318829 RepID=A0A4P7N9M6_PYROR|nr:hypothetical protein M0657_008043 [Pyricularia oryzae]KAI7918932.1 hypothetical protein M9X92_006633 [Pyricularia oryzae]QBZ59418.1 hypothetical protein PoMZ_04379 [Pyricularia oryzae]